MTTRNTTCDWVRARLPLETGPRDGDIGDNRRLSSLPGAFSGNRDRAAESGLEHELDSQERARVAQHLEDCAACRRHRAELRGALSVLAAVAELNPNSAPTGVDIDTGSRSSSSLWPALAQRIQEHEAGKHRRLTLGPIGREPLSTRAWLLAARCRDTVLETVDEILERGRDLLPFSERSLGIRPRPRLRPGFVLAGLVASVACGVIVLQLDRDEAKRRSEVAQASQPLVATPASETSSSNAELDSLTEGSNGDLFAESDSDDQWIWNSSSGTFTASTDDETTRGSRSSSPNANGGLPGPLAQAEIASPRRSSSTGNGAGNGAAGATPTSKFDYDLERGTPMAPDLRDAKPSY